MTEGPVIRRVLLFALPICLGNILQQLYNTVDTLIISRWCDANSLAAVGTAGQPVEFLLCLFMGLSSGVSILTAQSVGRRDLPGTKAGCLAAVQLLWLISLPVTVVGWVLGPALLRLMQVPPETAPLAVNYMRIVVLATLGNLGYNINAGILRGLGDGASSLFFLLVSCLLNILLDLLFVAGMGMGVSGAALATCISMYVSWLLSVGYIRRRSPELGFPLLPRRADKKWLRQLVRISLPLGFNHSIYSVGHMFLQAVINLQGAEFIAGCSVGVKVNSMSSSTISAISSAGTTYAGQNLGAEHYDRLKYGGTRIPAFSSLLTFCLSLLTLLLSGPIVSLFGLENQVAAYARQYILYTIMASFLYAWYNGIICFANGLGVVRYPLIVNVLALWAVRIPTAWLFQLSGNGHSAMLCYAVSHSFALICMLFFYRTKTWKSIVARADSGKHPS